MNCLARALEKSGEQEKEQEERPVQLPDAGPRSPPGRSGCWEKPILCLGTQASQLLGAGCLQSLDWHGSGPWLVRAGCVEGQASITASSSHRPCQVAVELGPGAKVPGNWIAI